MWADVAQRDVSDEVEVEVQDGRAGISKRDQNHSPLPRISISGSRAVTLELFHAVSVGLNRLSVLLGQPMRFLRQLLSFATQALATANFLESLNLD